MKAVIQVNSGLWKLEKAIEVAATLQENDFEGWKYVVVDCKNGLGRIDVYDEDGELVFKGFMA